jgi:hypothetical protein
MVDDRADTNAGLTVENGMFGGDSQTSLASFMVSVKPQVQR